MKGACTFLLIALSTPALLSQSPGAVSSMSSLDSIARHYKTHDDVVNLIYTCIDTFLAEPVENRLAVLDLFDRTKWRPLTTNDEHIAYVILQCNKGYYSARFGNINSAVDSYETAWKIYSDNQLEGFDIIEYCLKPLGNNYSMLGDYQSAANVIRNYLYIAERENNFTHVIAAFINLSVVYHDTGRQEEAIALLNDALKVKGIQESRKGIIHSNLARNFLDLRQISEARRHVTEALQYFKKSNDAEGTVHYVNALKILSLISMQEEKNTMALSFIEKAKSIIIANPDLFKKREMAKIINAYANINALQGQRHVAIKSYRQALAMLLPAYKPNNSIDLPDSTMLYPENAIKESLDGLAAIYSEDDPGRALQCFELSFIVDDLLRQSYHYQEDQLQQQIEIRFRTEQCLALLFDMFSKTQDPKYVLQAFQLAERTKAIVLKEATAANKVRQYIKHDTLLNKEQELTFKKATLATELVLEQMKGEAARIEIINDLISKETSVGIEIKSLQKKLVQKYPQYKTGVAPNIDLERLKQKLLAESATMIAYVAGQKALFAFIVNARGISFQKIVNAEAVFENVRKLNDMFSSATAINNDIEGYKRIASELSRQLMIPVSGASKKLVIIPDGILSHLPFEILLLEEHPSVNYAALPYLLKRFTITYESSATNVVDYKRSASPGEKGILGIFPVFKDSPRSLKYSETEATGIQSLAKGKFLIGDKATKKAFAENFPDFGIIHLSTHADAGSWLQPPSIDFIDSTLYLPEVYGLHLQPNLMVLSACETGVGKIMKGEGALSLARGFQYAGVNNIIFSLWKVNDHTTATLMNSFYQHFFGYETVPEALRQSKLDYLENDNISNAHKSPYFWAPFVYYGDVSNDTQLKKPIPIWLIASLMVTTFTVMVVIFWIARKNYRKGAKR